MKKISIGKLRREGADVFERVAETGEPLLVTRRGRVLAQIVPPPDEMAEPARVDERRAPETPGEETPEPAAVEEIRADERATRRRPRRQRASEFATDEAIPPPPAEAVGERQEPAVGELDDEADFDEQEAPAPAIDSVAHRPEDRVPEESFLPYAIPQHPVETTEGSFAALGLSAPILASLEKIGFHSPTPIQQEVIPPALEGRDVIGLAQTGSGKTAAFCLPLAERLTHGRGVRGLILAPTREIALQTRAFLELFGEDHRLATVCLIGGVRIGPQMRALRAKPDVVVATPGRLLDHLRRRTLSLDGLEELIFDEADHMLDLGFLPQILDVLDYVPEERRTMMFSATMPEPIDRLARRLMDDPVRIDILPEGRAAEGITHRLYLVDPDDKKDCLLELLNLELGSTLVFIRRKIDAEWLSRVLVHEGHPVERIHSDLTQAQRVETLKGFREGEHRILVATDIAARGIDVPRIQHIINFDLPSSVEDYIHRAGRTARGRLKGVVSSIATWQDKMTIREIEAAIGEELPRCTVPGVEPWEELKARPRSRGRHKLPVRRRL